MKVLVNRETFKEYDVLVGYASEKITIDFLEENLIHLFEEKDETVWEQLKERWINDGHETWIGMFSVYNEWQIKLSMIQVVRDADVQMFDSIVSDVCEFKDVPGYFWTGCDKCSELGLYKGSGCSFEKDKDDSSLDEDKPQEKDICLCKFEEYCLKRCKTDNICVGEKMRQYIINDVMTCDEKTFLEYLESIPGEWGIGYFLELL